MGATRLVFSFIGADRPGLVDRLSSVVGDHDGNWLESRLVRLGGKFAGIVEVAVDGQRQPALIEALAALSADGLTVHCEDCDAPADATATQVLRLSVMGPDRRHIVHEVSSALAERRFNVTELNTDVRPAPMSGESLFTAAIEVEVPEAADLGDLQAQLDRISHALTVEIDLESD